MDDFSVLIGGKAGFGIDKAGGVIASLFSIMGYRIHVYRDYPSIIRGGHTFSIIRAAKTRIAAHNDKVDIVLALNQDTLDLHKNRLKRNCFFIFDSEQVKIESESSCGLGIPLGELLKEESAPEIMRNTCVIGAFAKAAGVEFNLLAEALKKEFTKEIDLNLKMARRGYDAGRELVGLEVLKQQGQPLLTGNQAIALGLIKAGLNAYIAYPMTPSSPILHYLAGIAEDFALDVVHPESEISVILMALGYAYAGNRAAVGTSGGGFCLMTEGLSLAGMAELPIVIVLGQRPGPSTGLPTYSAQTELLFALNAGQGEFLRLVVAPGDAEEAYYWSAVAMNMSWKYQVPSIILSDKNLGEDVFNFDLTQAGNIEGKGPLLWDGESSYKRYQYRETGISPMAFPPQKDAIIKVNSYEHDELGITTEDPEVTRRMQDKRLHKERFLAQDLEGLGTVKIYGKKDAQAAILCWGSNKGVCLEVALKLGLKVIQPVVFSPFSVKQFKEALLGTKRLICVESNATGQLTRFIKSFGFNTTEQILKYDGRPFSVDELEGLVKGAIE